MSNQPTPAAIRAAIDIYYNRDITTDQYDTLPRLEEMNIIDYDNVIKYASIIDRETALPELVEAIEVIIAAYGRTDNSKDFMLALAIKAAIAALAKAEGTK
ncbi:MAG: hypothetical protein PHW53_04600 [Patescibacteria group bacterium]|nr:hypothetical protein [Patescibacteria group bacterium]